LSVDRERVCGAAGQRADCDACDKCGRKGRYAVARLIEQRGSDGKVLDLLAEISADCPKKQAGNMSDQCVARCPDLPKVM
jgi:hypothetical protein